MDLIKPFVVDLSVIALSEADKPTRIPICMIGTGYKGTQKFSITKSDVATMADNFAKRGNGEVVIDYDHASNQPQVAMGGPIPAAGWISSVDAEPDADGVVWGTATFTEKASAMIGAREYKFLSPVLNWASRDKNTGKPQGMTLVSVALTNTPVLDRMPAIRLSEAFSEDPAKGAENVEEKKEVMCSEHPKTPMLCPQCDADKIKTLSASEAGHHHGPKVLQLSEIGRDANGRLNLASLGGDAVLSIGAVRAIEGERVALSEVEAAIGKGKLKPAQRAHFEKLALSDIETFRGILATMTQQVDLSERGQGGTGDELDDLAKIDGIIDTKTREKMAAGKLEYHQAFKLVASENPELDRRRTRLVRRMKGGDDD